MDLNANCHFDNARREKRNLILINGDTMNITILPPVQIALRTLSDRERRQVLAWLDNLKNWENDQTVRDNSHQLEDSDNVYVLKTTSDIRIFFRLEASRITVLDIATKSTILSFGVDAE